MDKKIVILGAGGFAKEIYSTVTRAGYHVVSFLDVKEGNIYGVPVTTIDNLESCNNFVLAVGHPDLKVKLLKEVENKFGNVNFPVIIDPSAIIQYKVDFGKGCVVCAGSVLTTDIIIKDHVHINLNCTIGHDCMIGSFSQFSPGANISGCNNIGENVYLGTNSSTIEHINICDNVIVGAGAVVSKDIQQPGIYVGIPAKLRK